MIGKKICRIFFPVFLITVLLIPTYGIFADETFLPDLSEKQEIENMISKSEKSPSENSEMEKTGSKEKKNIGSLLQDIEKKVLSYPSYQTRNGKIPSQGKQDSSKQSSAARVPENVEEPKEKENTLSTSQSYEENLSNVVIQEDQNPKGPDETLKEEKIFHEETSNPESSVENPIQSPEEKAVPKIEEKLLQEESPLELEQGKRSQQEEEKPKDEKSLECISPILSLDTTPPLPDEKKFHEEEKVRDKDDQKDVLIEENQENEKGQNISPVSLERVSEENTLKDEQNIFYKKAEDNSHQKSQEDVRQEEKLLEESCPEEEGKIFADRIHGILVMGPDAKMEESEIENIRGVEFFQIHLCSHDQAVIRNALNPLLDGGFLSERKIQQAQRMIFSSYECLGRPFVCVLLPDQRISSGVLILEVIESRVGSIESLYNHHFSSRSLLKNIRLKKGEKIDVKRLSQDLQWLNRNPFRSSSIAYAAGKENYTTDLKLLTNDQFPFRVYTGIENTGFQRTGKSRVYAGFNWGNVWGLDHLLSYQYTSSLDFRRFSAHTAYYEMPLPWRHVIDIFGGYSKVKLDPTPSTISHLSEDGFRSMGTSWQVSQRYVIFLPRVYNILQQMQWGVDFKSTDNSYSYGESLISASHVNLSQAMMGYQMTFAGKRIKGLLETELFVSPGKIFPDQSNQLFDQLRPFAKNRYFYVKGTLQTLIKFPHEWTFQTLLRGQYANQNLLPSEQVGIGGYYSVRGFAERKENVDKAVLASFELRTPQFRFLSRPSSKAWKQDQLQFLAFFDYGKGFRVKKSELDGEFPALGGVGPGIRYRIDSWLDARLDWGFPVIGKKVSHSNSKVHFGLTISY